MNTFFNINITKQKIQKQKCTKLFSIIPPRKLSGILSELGFHTTHFINYTCSGNEFHFHVTIKQFFVNQAPWPYSTAQQVRTKSVNHVSSTRISTHIFKIAVT